MALPTHKTNPVVDYSGNWDWGMARLFIYGIAGLSLFILMVAGCNQLREVPWEIKTTLEQCEDTVIVKTIAEIPKGNYLHRIVDTDTDVVCYLNAVGGGIQCFSIKEIEVLKGTPLPENFSEKPAKRYSYYYNDTSQNTSYHSKGTIAKALND